MDKWIPASAGMTEEDIGQTQTKTKAMKSMHYLQISS